MQASHLGTYKRKPARRIDWLVYVLYDKISFEYTVRRLMQFEGRVWNATAHEVVNNAILLSKQPENRSAAVKLDYYSYSVKRFKNPGVNYNVLVQPTKDVECPCSTMCKKQHVCWHIISCLLAEGKQNMTS